MPQKVNKKMAYYDESCIKKIETIQHFQEKKYFPLAMIRNILRRMDDGFTLEEAEAVEDAVFAPSIGSTEGLLDRQSFLEATGLSPQQLDELEHIGLIMPFIQEKKKVSYNEEDVLVGRDAMRQIYRFGINPSDLEFYIRLAHDITNHEVALRRRIIKGLSAKDNIEVTTNLTRAANQFRGYILRRLFQRKIQSHIQQSLNGRKK